MDRTVLIIHTRNRRDIKRRREAWARFAPDGDCPYCGHGFRDHALRVGQPHFFRPATPVELAGQSVRLYRLPDDDGSRYRRVVVEKHAEVKLACCLICGEAKVTPQAMCYQAKVAVGEVVGATTK